MVQSGIDQLREQVRGAVITPDDEGYEQARRVYNAMIDRRPLVTIKRRYDPDNLFHLNQNIRP
jgi:3-dehydroquinate synthase class II